jgi:hypothetical protein
MKRFTTLGLLLVLALGLRTAFAAADSEAVETLTLPELAAKIEAVEKQEVVLTGQIVGACKSGCKMWVAAGDYKDGDLFTLVRAKDDAFKFDTQATGKQVVMRGFAVASYMDYCADAAAAGEQAAVEHAAKVAEDDCKAPVNTNAEAKAERKLQDLTFFATTVEYK